MRGSQFAERKCAIQNRLQASSKYVPKDFVQFSHRPHIRAEQLQLPREKMAQIESYPG